MLFFYFRRVTAEKRHVLLKPCYIPMLAGRTLYRDSRERNRKKHCFLMFYDFFRNPRPIFLSSYWINGTSTMSAPTPWSLASHLSSLYLSLAWRRITVRPDTLAFSAETALQAGKFVFHALHRPLHRLTLRLGFAFHAACVGLRGTARLASAALL